MTDLSPALVMQALLDLEREMAERQGEYETAAAETVRAKGEYDKAFAKHLLEAEGTVDQCKAKALLACVKGGEYERMIEAQAINELQKRAISSRADRASDLQSVLRALTREELGGALTGG